MNIYEITLVAALCLLVGGAFWVAYRSQDPTVFWNPLTMFASVFAYYFIIGPLIALSMGSTNIYGIELRDVMWKPWLAGTLGLSCIYCGFAIKTNGVRARLMEGIGPAIRPILFRCFYILFGLGALGFLYDAYISGMPLKELLLPIHSGLAFDASSAEREGFAAGNYLLLLADVFIPALCVLCAATAYMPTFKRLLIVGIPAIQVELFYASWGFRHRIVSLITSLAATFYILRGKRPSPGLLALGASGLVLIAGFVVLTRSYGSGLDLRQLTGLRFSEIFLGGFGDSGTFFTTALVMDSYPKTFPFVGLEPFWIAMTIPVPRAFWPGKPVPEFLDQIQYLTGTGGQAIPVVGEHYVMGGWIGIIIGGLIIGFVYRRFWNFYRCNPRNPLVIAVYAVSWALIFPVVNRGYLAQTLMEFFFTLLPLAVLYWFCRKSMLLRSTRAVL